MLNEPTILFLAQANGQANSSGGGAATAPNPMGSLLWGLVIFIVVFYFVLFRGDKKRKRKSDDMIKNLKKNDRIVTIGGIVGTVVSTKDEEVVVKVDETSNTKMTFVRGAIQRVLAPEDDQGS